MNNEHLYNTFTQAGFQIFEFMDSPGSFGSWCITVLKGHDKYRVVYDGRDKVITLEKQDKKNTWVEVDNKECKSASEMSTITELLSNIDKK